MKCCWNKMVFMLIIRCLCPFSLSNIHSFIHLLIWLFSASLYGAPASSHNAVNFMRKENNHSQYNFDSKNHTDLWTKKKLQEHFSVIVCVTRLNYQFYSHPKVFLCLPCHRKEITTKLMKRRRILKHKILE